MVKKVFLATKNRGKISEIKEILGGVKEVEIYSMLDGIDIPDVVENGMTFEENSLKKAAEIHSYLKDYTVIADDSGISAYALDGAPGIYSARFAGESATDDDNNKKLAAELKNKDDKRVKYTAVITVVNGSGRVFTYRGEAEGKFTDTPKGINGFGYDPYFYYEQYDKTFGELEPTIKNKISHRGIALELLKNDIANILEI